MQSFPQLLMGPSNVKFESKNDNFDSAFALHIFENPEHLVLFEEATSISTVNGLSQPFKEAIEIKNNINSFCMYKIY